MCVFLTFKWVNASVVQMNAKVLNCIKTKIVNFEISRRWPSDGKEETNTVGVLFLI